MCVCVSGGELSRTGTYMYRHVCSAHTRGGTHRPRLQASAPTHAPTGRACTHRGHASTGAMHPRGTCTTHGSCAHRARVRPRGSCTHKGARALTRSSTATDRSSGSLSAYSSTIFMAASATLNCSLVCCRIASVRLGPRARNIWGRQAGGCTQEQGGEPRSGKKQAQGRAHRSREVEPRTGRKQACGHMQEHDDDSPGAGLQMTVLGARGACTGPPPPGAGWHTLAAQAHACAGTPRLTLGGRASMPSTSLRRSALASSMPGEL